jgi:hypothetical protein
MMHFKFGFGKESFLRWKVEFFWDDSCFFGVFVLVMGNKEMHLSVIQGGAIEKGKC